MLLMVVGVLVYDGVVLCVCLCCWCVVCYDIVVLMFVVVNTMCDDDCVVCVFVL